MLRQYLTNKWVLSAIGFLIVLSVACVLWYQHDIADEKQQIVEAEKLLRQFEKSQKTNIVKENVNDNPAESNTPTAEKPITDDTSTVSTNDETLSTEDNQEETITVAGRVIRLSDIPDVPKESPHGFGPFPEVPDDYNDMAIWNATDYYTLSPESQRSLELLDRVLIKLWSSGERNFKGGKLDGNNGKVYPNYFNTVYITVEDRVSVDGTVVPAISRQVGQAPVGVDLLNPPSHINVLDYETSGIDPFQYLDLP